MPSKPSTPATSTSQSQTQVQLPPWLEAATQNVIGTATALSNLPGGAHTQPLPQYQVAPITAAGQSDIQALQGNIGSTNPAFAAAQQGAQGVMGYQPQQITPGFLSGTDLAPYMNPYTQQVIDKTMPLLEQQRQQSLNQVGDLAARTGAFGGSRQGVAEGVTNAQSGLYAGQLGAQLNQANFSQAQQAAMADLNRSLAAQQSNQQAGLQGGQLNLAGAQGLGNLAAGGQQAFLQGASGALAGQTQLQQQKQAELDAPTRDALQRLQILESAVGSVPYGTTQTTNSNQSQATSSNPWLTGLGALGTVAGIGGSLFGQGGIWPGSDRELKKDIKKVGKDEETGLPLYAYRYKGDPKTYPKVVGIMAQDVAEKYPDQVAKVGDTLVVNPDFGPMRRSFLG